MYVNSEEVKRTILDFLDQISEQNITTWNENYYDSNYIENFKIRSKAQSMMLNDIVELYDPELFKSTPDQWMIFQSIVYVNFILSYLEGIKKSLMLIIDESQIPFNENTTLGTFLKKICEKIGYDTQLRQKIMNIFLVDFRNAIAHQHYEMIPTELKISHNGQILTYTISDLIELSNISSVVLTELNNFINKQASISQ